MLWNCWKGNKKGWKIEVSISAKTPEKALSAFLQRESFFPDTILEKENSRIAYQKGTNFFYIVFLEGYGPHKPNGYQPPLSVSKVYISPSEQRRQIT